MKKFLSILIILTLTSCSSVSRFGAGVDIKHNSYDRYLARLKGKKPLRQQAVPSAFAKNEIPFNRADPVYGGKMFKLGIIE